MFVNHFFAVCILFKTILILRNRLIFFKIRRKFGLDAPQEPIDVTSGTFGELIQLCYDVTLHQSPKYAYCVCASKPTHIIIICKHNKFEFL